MQNQTPPLNDKFSLISHVAQLYNLNEGSDPKYIAAYTSQHMPAHFDADRVATVVAFVEKYVKLFDCAICDMVDQNINNYRLDLLIALADRLFIAYVTGSDMKSETLRMHRFLNRYYAAQLPLNFLWWQIRCELFHVIKPGACFARGVGDANILAAIEVRYVKKHNGSSPLIKQENEDMSNDKKIQEVLEKVSEIDKIVHSIMHGGGVVVEEIKALQDEMGLFKKDLTDLKDLMRAPTGVAAPATAAAQRTPVAPVAPVAAAPVQPIVICQQKNRAQRENEEYAHAVNEWIGKFFPADSWDIAGALSSLKASAATLNIEKFVQMTVTEACRRNPKADMSQMFKVIFWLKEHATTAEKVAPVIAADNTMLSKVIDMLTGYVEKDRSKAFSASECLRKNPATQELGLAFMGW